MPKIDDDADRRIALEYAAHDLRQPLAAAVLLLGELRRQARSRGCDAGRVSDHIGQNLLAMADRIIDFERILAGGPARNASFDLGQATAAAMTMASPVLAEAGIQSRLTLAPTLQPFFGSRLLFEQLIFNLLDCIAQHAVDARLAHMRLEHVERRHRLTVAHDGNGWCFRPTSVAPTTALAACSWAVRMLDGRLHRTEEALQIILPSTAASRDQRAQAV